MRLASPVRTLPAPTSTSRSTPCADEIVHALAPAHGSGHLLDEPAHGSRPGRSSGWRCTFGDQRHHRRDYLSPSPAHRASRRPRAASARNGRARRPAASWRACAPAPSRSRPRARPLPCCRRRRSGPARCRSRPAHTSPCAASAAISLDQLRARGRGAPPSRPARPAPPAAWRGRGCAASCAASASEKAPAAASAEYSPSEWPATKRASRPRSSPASPPAREPPAIETAISAGCAFSVRVSLSAGPSHMMALSLSPSASSTSSKTARAGAKASASALPMPTAWLPCPGNVSAIANSVPRLPAGRQTPPSDTVSSASRERDAARVPHWDRGAMQLQSRRSPQHRNHHFLSTRPRADAESRRAPASRPHEARSAFARGRGAERRGPRRIFSTSRSRRSAPSSSATMAGCPRSKPKGLDAAVDGEVERRAYLSLAELRREFERVSMTAVLECAGNGRAGFAGDVRREMESRRGRLRAVDGRAARRLFVAAGVKRRRLYRSLQSGRASRKAGRAALSRGLPIEKALAPETFIAFEMNDRAIAYLHGGPFESCAGLPRLGMAEVATRIAVRDREHDGEKMCGTEYRMPHDSGRAGRADRSAQFAVITDMPVKSLITAPLGGFRRRCRRDRSARLRLERSRAGRVGRCFCGRRSLMARGGARAGRASLRVAAIQGRVSVPPGPLLMMSRATDAEGRSQPLERPRLEPARLLQQRGASRAGAVVMRNGRVPCGAAVAPCAKRCGADGPRRRVVTGP